MSLYRNVLKQAWQTTWRYKSLWFFGFLASFWGIGSAYEIVYRSLRLPEQKEIFLFTLWQDLTANGFTWQNLKIFTIKAPLTVLTIILGLVIIIAILLCLYWIFTCSQIMVIKAVDVIQRKKQTFRGLFSISKKYFWPVFAINLGGKIIITLLLFLLSYPLLKSLLLLEPMLSLSSFLIYLGCFIIIFILVLIISLAMIYAIIYITLKGETIGQAIIKGWRIFVANWLVSLETALILFIISLLVGLIVFIFSSIALLPFFLLLALTSFVKSTIGFWLIIFLVAALIVIIIVLATALLTTFQLGVWVNLFNQLEAGKATSKLQRLSGKILKE